MIVIVLGMHRSGTSALAGLLHHNGVHMGDQETFYPPPMKENPKGFFENKRFRNLNDAMLSKVGYKVKSFNPIIPRVQKISQELSDKMTILLTAYNQRFTNWGWKDPRTSLTIHHWLEQLVKLGLLDQLRIIMMVRSAKQIRDSMLRRGNKEQYEGQFVDLANSYYKRCCDVGTVDFTTVNFDDLINETKRIAFRLSNYLGHDIVDLSFVEPGVSKEVA